MNNTNSTNEVGPEDLKRISEQGERLEPQNASGKSLFPDSITMVACDQCDEAMPWPLRCGHAYIGVHSREYTRRAAVAGPHEEKLKTVVQAAIIDHIADGNWPNAAESLEKAVEDLLNYRAAEGLDTLCQHCQQPVHKSVIDGCWFHVPVWNSVCDVASSTILKATPIQVQRPSLSPAVYGGFADDADMRPDWNDITPPAAASSAAPAESACLLCGHNEAVNGYCTALVPICSDDYHGTRFCGCKCKFTTPPESTGEQLAGQARKALKRASKLCHSTIPGARVELIFQNLEDAQAVHKWLITLVAAPADNDAGVVRRIRGAVQELPTDYYGNVDKEAVLEAIDTTTKGAR